jgi:uncharacterized protein (TIGR00661 family)
VVGVLAGAHRNRSWPDFFERGFDTPVHRLASPGFVYRNGRQVNLPATAWQFITRAGHYRRSLDTLQCAVRETAPDLIINFLEPLVGVCSRLRGLGAPVLAVGHQFMLAHPAYPKPPGSPMSAMGLRNYVRVTGARAVHYALSFYEAPDVPERDLFVAPPLLRDELFHLERGTNAGHLLVYLLNAGYRPEIEAWHRRHPEIPLHVFYDRADAVETESVDPTLTFHRLHGEKFLNLMANCRGVVCTAGFESLSEAAWLGKPALAVPVQGHIEQALNAVDAEKCGIALPAAGFDLDPLLTARTGPAQERFRTWAEQSDTRLLRAVRYAASKAGTAHRSSALGRTDSQVVAPVSQP